MTSGGQAAVARATAAVFIDGRRGGSAIVVDPRYLLTAAHVLLRLDSGTGAKVPVEQVELEFPARELGGQPGRATASRLGLGPVSAGVDVAVLDLGEDRLGWLPAPVPVWPAARPPRRVQVFGYPLAEGPLNGVWRQFVVAGPATPGAVQLDWIGEVGTFHQVLTGHDGGVWAVAVGRLPDGTPVIISGGNPGDGTVRVWRLADGTPVGEPLTGHDGTVRAVAVGALPDGTPVIVSGGSDRTVRAWRLADGTPLAHPLDLSESAGASPFTAISSSPRPGRTSPSTTWPLHGSYEIVLCPAATVGRHGHRIMAGYPVHRRADASTAMLMACDGHTSTRSPHARCDSDGYVTHQYKQTTTLGTDIGRYRERTSGERDNQTFGA